MGVTLLFADDARSDAGVPARRAQSVLSGPVAVHAARTMTASTLVAPTATRSAGATGPTFDEPPPNGA